MLASAVLVMLAQAAPIPWIPPLRSRALVEVAIAPDAVSGTLEKLTRECAIRGMALVSRTESDVKCASEADYAGRLAYMTAWPRPDGPLQGYVRFTVIRSTDSVRVQALRYAEYQVAGEKHQMLSEDTELLKEMLDRVRFAGQ